MTVKDLIEFLEQIEDTSQPIVLVGKHASFVRATFPAHILLTPGYNWNGDKEEPAILIEPLLDKFRMEVDE